MNLIKWLLSLFLPDLAQPSGNRPSSSQTRAGKSTAPRPPGLNIRRAWHIARHIDGHYREFEMQFPGGKTRPIAAPDDKLRWVQRRILDKTLSKIDLCDACHGFRRKRSIVTNALPHVGKPLVMAVDVEDFFPSITFPRVYGLFKSLGYDKKISALLAKLTTYKNTLPQGAPTSPAIANLICRKLDRRLAGLAKTGGFTYTRYADDLTFSGPVSTGRYLSSIQRIVEDEGFKLNPAKTRIMRRNQRQQVTGVVVNDKAGLPREWRRKLRSALHHLRNGVPAEDNPAVISGRLAFLKMVHPTDYKREVAALKAIS